MIPSVGAARARAHAALVLTAGVVLGVLLPSLVVLTPERLVVAVAVTVAVLALAGWGVQRCLPRCDAKVVAHQRRTAGAAHALRTDRATDVRHHPLRPRAPGLV